MEAKRRDGRCVGSVNNRNEAKIEPRSSDRETAVQGSQWRADTAKKNQSARKNSSVDLTLQIPCATTWQRTSR
jgi:hypothetical protein